MAQASRITTTITWIPSSLAKPTFAHHVDDAPELGYMHNFALTAQHAAYIAQLHALIGGLIPSRAITVGGTTYPSTDTLWRVVITLPADGWPPTVEIVVVHTYSGGQEKHMTYAIDLPQAVRAAFVTWAAAVRSAGYAAYGLVPPS